MLRNELHSKKAEIEAAAEKYGAKHIRIFGSVARGEERTDSDIDFLVDLPRGYDLFFAAPTSDRRPRKNYWP